jgi:hypothetical protein
MPLPLAAIGLVGALGALLVDLAGFLAKKAFVAIGFGVVVFTGWEVAKDALVATIDQNLGGMPGSVFQIFALGGGVDAIGIMLGGVSTLMAAAVLKKVVVR